ncbi:MAG: ATP-binding cassette domain-containing protein, partial [Betaproteobacteria bacterium]
MALLSLDGAGLAFGHVALLDHASLQLDRGERAGLIGRNGSGKSSLLRVLAGEASLDDGILRIEPGARIALVPQEPGFDPQLDVYDAIAGGLGAIAARLIAYHDLGARLGNSPAPEQLDALHALQTELEHGDGWRMNTRVEQTVSSLGLAAADHVGALSG